MGGCGRRSAISYCTGLFRALADQHPGNAFFFALPGFDFQRVGPAVFKGVQVLQGALAPVGDYLAGNTAQRLAAGLAFSKLGLCGGAGGFIAVLGAELV
jgi:hypothetical protein